MCVIGAGTAGFIAAQTARALGKSVLLVSGPGDLGGTCILRGCMPAKTLLSSTERLGNVETAAEVGVTTNAPRVDLRALIARKRELTDYFAEDRVQDLETYPLSRGCARFVAPDTIEVDVKRITADRFVIATGSKIVPPAIDGLSAAGFITSDDALEMTQIPASIAVIGGGPVGCEFSQYFARLGARVTLLQDAPLLLRNEDEDMAVAVAGALTHDGVELICDADVVRCARDGEDRVVTYMRNGETRDVRVNLIMLATNRLPNTAALGLESAGIRTGARGEIVIDEFLNTTNDRTFAAGDVIGRRCLVHVAAYAGRLAVHNAFAREPRAADFDRFEAHAVYTQPQVAVTGLTERTCAERGLDVSVRRHPFHDVGKALVSGQVTGFVKMIAGADDRILGVAIFGEDAIDLIGEAVALIDAGSTTQHVAEMPHLHPAMGEILARVAEDFTAA